MRLRLLALPAALALGAASVLLALAWERDVEVLSPQLAPSWWRGGPELLAAAALGALGAGVLAARRAASGPATPAPALASAARWLALAAGAVLLAQSGLLSPAPTTDSIVLRFDVRAWWPGAAVALLLGGALVAVAHAAGRAETLAAVCTGAAGVLALGLLHGGRAAELALEQQSALALALGAALLAALAAVAQSGFAPRATASAEDVQSKAPSRRALVPAGTAWSVAVLGAALAVVLAAALQRVSMQSLLPGHWSSADSWLWALCGAALGAGLAAGWRPVAATALLRCGWVLALFGWIALLSTAPGIVQPAGSFAETASETGAALLLAATGAGLARLAVTASRAASSAAALGALLAGAALGVWLWGALHVHLSGAVTATSLQLVAVAACIGALLVAVVVAVSRGATRMLRVSALVLVLAALPPGLLAWHQPSPRLPAALQPGDHQLLARAETLTGVVDLVALFDGRTVLRRDGQPGLDEHLPRLLLRRVGRLSAALQPSANTALLIGRDAGDLLAGLAATSSAQVTVLEPQAAALALAPDLAWEPGQFALGGAILALAEPVRAALLRRRAEFDLIVAHAGGGLDRAGRRALTHEHFLALRGALREGGVAVQWLPLHVMAWPEFAAVAAAFVAAFPETRVLLASARSDRPLLALVGGGGGALPGPEELDALLSRSPAGGGPAGAADVYDLYLCDGWALERALGEVARATLARPLPARAPRNPELVAQRNLRLLAELAQPLETTSLRARPVDEKQHKLLGAELTARSAALLALLVARAAALELSTTAPEAWPATWRDALEREQEQALLFGWRAAAGHLDVREALLERANLLATAGRREAAEALLGEALAGHDDPLLAGMLGGLLLRQGRLPEALARLEPAGLQAPADRTVLANLAAARLAAGEDEGALVTLQAAAEVFGPRGLPPLHAAALALLEQQPGALQTAERLAAELPAGDPWQQIFARLCALPDDSPR